MNQADIAKPEPLAAFFAYDQEDIALYSHARGYARVLWDLQETLRGWLKHGHGFDCADSALQAVRKELFEARTEAHLPEL